MRTQAPLARPLLLDGAMGTELERRGARMDAPLWSAHALIDNIDIVEAIHRDYLRAGADVIVTNTFRTHARNLRDAEAQQLQSAQQRAHELTTVATQAALRARAATQNSKARIAGSMSPLEDCFAPSASPEEHVAFPEHQQMAQTLAESGCDLFLIETMSRIDEAVAAVRACQQFELPIWLSVVGNETGTLLGTETFVKLVDRLHEIGMPVDALLINCTDIGFVPRCLDALVAATQNFKSIKLGIYPHTGHNHPVNGWQTHAVSQRAFTQQVQAQLKRHPRLSIVGSCCGSTPDWTTELHKIRTGM